MEKIKLTILIARALQILFALVVLGTSISMVKRLRDAQKACDYLDRSQDECGLLRLPASTSFSAFVGGFSALASTVNLATEIIHFLPFIASLGLDGLTLLFFTASGVNLVAVRAQWNSIHGSCGENGEG
ncbi:hypothetical protein HII31_06513 [Pseudocercospora fuligena]|uniref:MARVEL domain-containing protein n=1 Tax=Pseudocercospora fuligena TaxID=685502 RepID=A0A8H6RKA1_9PEZI|nr:hypothetical protein HII31_06513 [Pseudocercospora fuligena]